MKEAQKERAAAAREQKKLPKPARTLQGGFLPEFQGVISDKNQWEDQWYFLPTEKHSFSFCNAQLRLGTMWSGLVRFGHLPKSQSLSSFCPLQFWDASVFPIFWRKHESWNFFAHNFPLLYE